MGNKNLPPPGLFKNPPPPPPLKFQIRSCWNPNGWNNSSLCRSFSLDTPPPLPHRQGLLLFVVSSSISFKYIVDTALLDDIDRVSSFIRTRRLWCQLDIMPTLLTSRHLKCRHKRTVGSNDGALTLSASSWRYKNWKWMEERVTNGASNPGLSHMIQTI